MDITTELLTDFDQYNEIDELRKEVFNITNGSGSYYLNGLINNKLKAIAAKNNDEMIAGCYFHNYSSNLIIDMLFVKEEYQETGLKLGRNLVLNLLDNKEQVEKILHSKLTTSSIEPINEKAEALYKKIGYKSRKNSFGVMYKAI